MLPEELCMLQVNDQFELSKVSKSSKKAGWNTDLLPVFLVKSNVGSNNSGGSSVFSRFWMVFRFTVANIATILPVDPIMCSIGRQIS